MRLLALTNLLHSGGSPLGGLVDSITCVAPGLAATNRLIPFVAHSAPPRSGPLRLQVTPLPSVKPLGAGRRFRAPLRFSLASASATSRAACTSCRRAAASFFRAVVLISRPRIRERKAGKWMESKGRRKVRVEGGEWRLFIGVESRRKVEVATLRRLAADSLPSCVAQLRRRTRRQSQTSRARPRGIQGRFADLRGGFCSAGPYACIA